MWAFIGGAVLTLTGVFLAGVLLNAARLTGNISDVLTKAGWFGAAGIPAIVAAGLFFLRVALRREWSGLAAKRVMTGIAALFLLAFLFIEWVPMAARRDNSVDADKVLEQSRETLKHVDSEMERIKSETDEAILAYEFETKAKQPNTIYVKTVGGELTLENLMTVDVRKETDTDSQDPSTAISMPRDLRVSVSNGSEYSGHFAYRIELKELTSELGGRGGYATQFVGDLEKWRETEPAFGELQGVPSDRWQKSESSWTPDQIREGRPVVLAFRAELRTSSEPMDEDTELQEPDDNKRFNQPHDTPEIKAFVATLRYGESGEFGGWHYLKVDRTVPEEFGADE
ncbi:hypothetical protein N9153_02150 [Planctomicrobium sp.]|nr:hypothetical protein [Planctomicrobium sp.]